MERALRQPLLSADPYLRSDHRQAGCCDPAARQDAERGRGGAGPAPCYCRAPRPLPGGRARARRRRGLGPAVDIVVRGDSHSGRAQAMAWCERQRVGYIFGPSGNPVLRLQVSPLAEDAALGRLDGEGEKVRRYGDFRYAAKSWTVERRVIARVEAGPQGADSRFIVTNLPGLPKMLYEKVYCGRGQAENLIKAHKLHLASDRTSCRKATANQFRLLIHTAAYWLMLNLRGLAPRTSFW